MAIKVNIVTMPLVVNGRKRTNFWDDDKPHWGQVTDLRVVKSVIDYLVNEEGDASRITIVEGGAEWNKLGEEGTDPDQTEDGWTVHWEAFDNLSYADIVSGLDGTNGIEVDIVDLNYDDWVGTEGVGAGDPLPVPDPNGTGVTWYQRPEGYYVSKTLLEVDKLVNIAAMKTHDIPGVTLLHKQYVGTLMQRAYGVQSNSKYDLHDFGNMRVPWGFIDLFSYRPTDYGIIEGFWGTEGNGPQWGEDVNHNVVIAGADPVAVDAVGASIMGYNPVDLVYLRLSAAKGFGTYDLDHIHIIGNTIEEVRREFVRPENAIFWGMGNRTWLVNGPHPSPDITQPSIADEGAVRPKEGMMTNGIEWQVLESLERQAVLPDEIVDGMSATYAFVYVQSDREQDGFLYLGLDDGGVVYLNGDEVFMKMQTGHKWNSVTIPVHLQSGANAVMVKVRNRYAGASLSLVVGDERGDALPGIEFVLEPKSVATAVEEDAGVLPSTFTLGQSYPNPFNSQVVIPYDLPQATQVTLRIYDVRGARVRTLMDGVLAGGHHVSIWDAADDNGQRVGSGTYLYQLAAGRSVSSGRMVLLK